MNVHFKLANIFVLCFLAAAVDSAWDPYEVLGLKRGASTPEIRKAYKQYAKEW